MKTPNPAEAAEQLMEFMKTPDIDTATDMVMLAKYVADRGHMAAVCTEGDSACVIYYKDGPTYDAGGYEGWWKI